MKGTRLWTRAGSPLIHGRIRRQKPAYVSWIMGTVISAPLSVVVAYVFLSSKSSADVGTMLALAGPLLGGAVAGSLLGAWIATGFGSLRAWVGAAVSGVAVSWVAAAVYFLWAIQASGV